MEHRKILVAYGTRYGSARIVAGEIASYLQEQGHGVELVDLREGRMPVLSGQYDLAVVGSSVAMFSWVGRVKRFLGKCRKAAVPTAIYITCGTAIESPEKAVSRFMDKVIARIGINPVLTFATAPVIDFRPGEGLNEGLKKRIRATIEAMAKDSFKADGLMDMRDQIAFKGFLEALGGLLA